MLRIDPSSRVADGAKLADDVEIGPFCTIGPNVDLRAGVRLLSTARQIESLPVRNERDMATQQARQHCLQVGVTQAVRRRKLLVFRSGKFHVVKACLFHITLLASISFFLQG